MYCSSCGGVVVQGLSFCSQCGAKLIGETGANASKSSAAKPESLIWAMVAALVFGFVGIVFLLMAMKMVGLDVGPILAFTMLSFVIILLVEGVFISQLLRRKRSGEKSGETVLSKGQSTNELDAAHARVLPGPMPSVTEHTTRAFEPIYNKRTAPEERR